MQKGDLISITFTGRDTTTGKVFDTTSKEVAQKEGLPIENRAWAPVIVVVGQNEILSGLESALLKMKVGEKQKVVLEPANAFGERDPQLVKVIPLNEFTKNKIPPVPGTVVNANDMVGKVQSVSGGRVRVDFNSDLAGRTVEYDVEITNQFTDANEQLTALLKKAFPAWEKSNVKNEKGIVEVVAPIHDMTKIQRNLPGFSKLVLDVVKGTKEVRVTTVFTPADFKQMHVHEDGTMHGNEEHED